MNDYGNPLEDSVTDAELVRRAKLVHHWGQWFYDNTETWSGAVGKQLAYLWPAVIGGMQVEVTPQSAIVKLLKSENVPEDDEIWTFLDVVQS